MKKRYESVVAFILIMILYALLMLSILWMLPEESAQAAEISTEAPAETKDTSKFWTRPNLIDPPKELVVVERIQETVGAPEATTETAEIYTELATEAETTEENTEAPTPAPTETETVPEPETEASETIPETMPAPEETEIPLYSCHGLILPPSLQEYAYGILESYGMQDYYEYFLCQAYQESTYQVDQRTLNHDCWDCGLMQIREIYWSEWSAESGIVGDIMDPYDNIRMACYILSRYWQTTGDVASTISMYMSGWGGEWQEEYVRDVTGHMPYLQRIN